MFGYLMLIVGDTEAEQAKAADRLRSEVAFYVSSPMYRGVLDAIGCADLQGDLETLVKQGRWGELPGLVDDDVLDHFALRGHTRGAAGAHPGALRRPLRPSSPLPSIGLRTDPTALHSSARP